MAEKVEEVKEEKVEEVVESEDKKEVDIAELIADLGAKIDAIAGQLDALSKSEVEGEVKEEKVEEVEEEVKEEKELSEDEIDDLDKFLQG